ncbi:MAG: pseudaminic acid cytidylyltransferase [Eubacterium sp.]|nr:pseudaminic acid cytidylyltransferase [Eubacterium sp.]
MGKTLAVITARGGSKRIPRKNIKEFLGKPILAYPIEAAQSAAVFDEIMVSTDDPEIARTAAFYGAAVPFLRSEKTSGDYACTEDVIMEVIQAYEERGRMFDYVACLYPTAPFIKPSWLCQGLCLVQQPEVGMVMTAVRFSFPPQRCLVRDGAFVKYKWPEYMGARSQDLEPYYHDGGQFYYYDVKEFKKRNGLFAEGIAVVELPEAEIQDIDTPQDWRIAEMKYRMLCQGM